MGECDKANIPENVEEEIEETEEQADTDDLIRRSERSRQPPRRLGYTELGKPLVTVRERDHLNLTLTVSGEPTTEVDRERTKSS
ncbi:hypothetical protein INR49_029567, partial [Caranx melampygus]